MRVKGYKRCAAALVAAALLGVAPMAAQALETAPLTVGEPIAQRREDAGKLNLNFAGIGGRYRGVSAADAWMRQARLNGVMLNLRLFTPEGENVLMREGVSEAETGGKDIRLCLVQQSEAGGLLLQFDQRAVDILKRVNVTELVVVDGEGYVQQRYRVSDLAAMREALNLANGDQLSLCGEDAPVTVVSEDGVRRLIN